MEWGDVEVIAEEDVRLLQNQFPHIQAWLVGGSFPCGDLARLNAHRLNLEGWHSSLFTHIQRVAQLFELVFSGCRIFRFYENVMMGKEPLAMLVESIALHPVKISASDVVDCRRPRFYFCEWELHLDKWSRQKFGERDDAIRFKGVKKPTIDWIHPGLTKQIS